MDLDARAKRTRSPASAPAPSPSERTPSAKRAIVLPANPPPPSNPPSPPSGGDTLPLPSTGNDEASSHVKSMEGDELVAPLACTRSDERYECSFCAGTFTTDDLHELSAALDPDAEHNHNACRPCYEAAACARAEEEADKAGKYP
jgi:hypothetical protein